MEPKDAAAGRTPARGLVASLLKGGWSHAAPPQAWRVVTAVLGLAGPVALGALTGCPRIWMVLSLGGLALSAEGKGETLREQLPGMIYASVAGSAGVFAGSLLGAHGIAGAAGVVALARQSLS